MSEPLHESVIADVDGSRRLTRYYILALSAVALLSIAGQLFVQARLGEQLGDSKLVNTAGRQRMLSQRIVKCALVLNDRPAEAEKWARAEELRSSLELWRRCHDELRRGDAAVGHSEGNSSEAAAVFASLESTFTAISSAAGRIAANPQVAHPADLAVLLAEERPFLEGMDRIVAQYESEAQAKVARLRIIESILLVLTLGTLLLEGIYVFRPAARQIHHSFAALVRLSKDLRTARDVAESANLAKSRFLANVSHELRTPLHAILGAVEMAGYSPGAISTEAGADRQAEAMNVVSESARRQLALVNDLLDLSRIEAGRLPIAQVPFDLRELLERNAELIRPLAAERGLQFRVDLADDLPRYVLGDALRIGQVLTNLLGNACKFTDSGEIELRAYICRRPDDSHEIRFVVRDTGIGIPADQLQVIFNTFSQVNASGDRMREGAGLGLAVAKQLAELMQGRLEVESRLDGGSTFVLAFPYNEGPAAVAEQASKSADDIPGRSLRVLAVDDSGAGRRVLEAMLADLGHRPTCASDGPSTLAAFEQIPFDVVLLDLHMPGCDGRTTAAAIRACERAQRRSRTAVLLVTADATSEGLVGGPSTDFDGFLLKPFTSRELAAALISGPDDSPANNAQPTSISAVLAHERALARLGGNQGLLNELVDLFQHEGPKQFENLLTAASADDRETVFRLAHLMRGQLELLEQRAARLFITLENAAHAGSATAIREALEALQTTWPIILQDVESLKVDAVATT